jgi:Recombinase
MAKHTLRGIDQQREAKERAERLRGVFERLSSLSAKKAAEELNTRGVPAPLGGKWSAMQVIRVRQRLAQ